MTSKCGKNKKVAHKAQLSVSLVVLAHFDVLCDLLGSLRHRQDVCNTQDGTMTKGCRVRLGMQSRATFFRHSVVLLLKLPMTEQTHGSMGSICFI